jgi:hypothetical protein
VLSIVGVSLLEPLVSVSAAATPAKTRIALMMIAAFVKFVTPSKWVGRRLLRVFPNAPQARATPRQSLGKA